MLDLLDLPFVQRGLLEVAVLAPAAGILGTWIVLRGLAFFAHAVGTAAFPGLVLADGLGFAAGLGAFGTAAIVALLVALLGQREGEGDGHDATTALVLVGALAVGVVLASDVFGSQARVDQLLFGSLLLVDGGDVVFAAAASAAVLAATAALGGRWLVAGFDAGTARAAGLRTARTDAVLLALVALVAVASLSALGALLATALLVVPAATTRLVVDRLPAWQLATVGLVLAEGVGGVWLAVELNAPPGATIAVIAGAVFALVAAARALATRGPRGAGRAAAAAAALVLAATAAGCAGSDATGDGSTKIVVTTTQLGDIVREVGGDAVAVTQILQPNSDPHDYEPRPRDVVDAAGAELVFISGAGLDEWIGDLLADAGGSPRIVEPAAGRPYELAGQDGERFDPHWWHDPRN